MPSVFFTFHVTLLFGPPSESRLDTWYCTFGFACACARICAGAKAVAQQAAIKTVKHTRLTFLVMNRMCCCGVFMEVISQTASAIDIATSSVCPKPLPPPVGEARR